MADQIEVHPFIDIKLEEKILRQLILQDDRSTVIERNLTYVIEQKICKEMFSGEFKQWLFEVVVENFKEHQDSTPLEIIQERLKIKYLKPEEAARQRIFLNRIMHNTIVSHKIMKFWIRDLRTFYVIEKIYKDIYCAGEAELEEQFNNRKYIPSEILKDIQEKTQNLIAKLEINQIVEEGEAFRDGGLITLLDDMILHPELYQGIKTGFPKLDEITHGGWKKEHLIAVTGRTGTGKSILALNFGYSAYLLGYNVIIFTIEMSYTEQQFRLLSLAEKIPFSHFNDPNKLEGVDIAKVKARYEKEKDRRGSLKVISIPANWNIQMLENKILNYDKKIDLIIVDPMYNLRPTQKLDTEWEKLGSIAQDCKDFAKRLRIPVIVTVQMNRAAEEKFKTGQESTTADFSGSDKIGQIIDLGLVIRKIVIRTERNAAGKRIPVYDENHVNIEFPKFRHFAVHGNMTLYKNLNLCEFKEAKPIQNVVEEPEEETIKKKDWHEHQETE